MVQIDKLLNIAMVGAILIIASLTVLPNQTFSAAEKKPTPQESAPKETPPASKSPAPNAMPVEVTIIQPESIQNWKQYSGRVVAVDKAELRPQVSGRITEIRFDDGSYINKGDILIVIDPRPYEAALKQAEAALATAKTKEDLAEKEYKRAIELVEKKAVSESLLDTRGNNFQVAKAEILGAEAQVETAKINLDYAYVKAPISGKISRAEITIGNLVQSGPNAPLLTSIVADETVYIDFEIDEQTYIKSIRKTPADKIRHIPIRLELSGDQKDYKGFIQSFDNRIDQSTGTIRGRALFKNNEKLLLPGMSVSVLMGQADFLTDNLIVVTERAIGTDQDRKFVYVVSEDFKATYREVKIGANIEGRRIILSGLKPNDMVITEGLVRIRPNMPVAPKPIKQKTAQN